MRNSVDIDSRHSRAIVKEIGERLRASLKEDRELPPDFQKQIERLRQSDLPNLSLDDLAAANRRRHCA
jgi:hypothetical protein